MPIFQTMTVRFNSAFRNPAEERPELGETLADTFQACGIFSQQNARAERQFVETIPAAIQEAAMGAIRANLQRPEPVPITLCWKPGYEFGLELYDVPGTSGSLGGITMIFTSRYPADSVDR